MTQSVYSASKIVLITETSYELGSEIVFGTAAQQINYENRQKPQEELTENE